MASPVTPETKLGRVFVNKDKFKVLHQYWSNARQQQRLESGISSSNRPVNPGKEWWTPTDQSSSISNVPLQSGRWSCKFSSVSKSIASRLREAIISHHGVLVKLFEGYRVQLEDLVQGSYWKLKFGGP